MKSRRQLIVAGHTAVAGAWAHSLDSEGVPRLHPHPGGEGRAVCSCGAYSPVLPSQGKRQKWMREVHKPQVLEGQEART